MSNYTIALLLSLGASAWIYNKVYRSTGGNTKSSLVVAGSAALLLFLVTVTLLGMIPSN